MPRRSRPTFDWLSMFSVSFVLVVQVSRWLVLTVQSLPPPSPASLSGLDGVMAGMPLSGWVGAALSGLAAVALALLVFREPLALPLGLCFFVLSAVAVAAPLLSAPLERPAVVLLMLYALLAYFCFAGWREQARPAA